MTLSSLFFKAVQKFSLRRIAALGLLSLLLWILGLLLFVLHVESLTEPPLLPPSEMTDAIVVLTGGSERLSSGLSLLENHRGKKLFVSGVHQGFSIEHALNTKDLTPALRDCCVVLGYSAESTLGNAEETKLWMQLEKYQSMLLVTANYHMPRSLLLFHDQMPDLKIIPYPITPESVHLDQWWQHAGTASLLVTEYVKYLLALLRTELLP